MAPIKFEAQQLDLRLPTFSYQDKNFEQELFIFSDAGQKSGLPDVAQQLNTSFENPERLKNTKDLIQFDRLLSNYGRDQSGSLNLLEKSG